jgi:hypothetical protein
VRQNKHLPHLQCESSKTVNPDVSRLAIFSGRTFSAKSSTSRTRVVNGIEYPGPTIGNDTALAAKAVKEHSQM